jgi:hypothetical protein
MIASILRVDDDSILFSNPKETEQTPAMNRPTLIVAAGVSLLQNFAKISENNLFRQNQW